MSNAFDKDLTQAFLPAIILIQMLQLWANELVTPQIDSLIFRIGHVNLIQYDNWHLWNDKANKNDIFMIKINKNCWREETHRKYYAVAIFIRPSFKFTPQRELLRTKTLFNYLSAMCTRNTDVERTPNRPAGRRQSPSQTALFIKLVVDKRCSTYILWICMHSRKLYPFIVADK